MHRRTASFVLGLQLTGHHDKTTMMSTTPGGWLTATGFAFMLVGVSAGVGSSDFGLLLGFVGVLVGANIIAVGVRQMGGDEPIGPVAFTRVGALTTFLHRNLVVVGIILSSSAVTAIARGEAGPLPCFALFAAFFLGLWFINIGVLERNSQ